MRPAKMHDNEADIAETLVDRLIATELPERSLTVSLVALPCYYLTNPVLAGIPRYAIEQTPADFKREA